MRTMFLTKPQGMRENLGSNIERPDPKVQMTKRNKVEGVWEEHHYRSEAHVPFCSPMASG